MTERSVGEEFVRKARSVRRRLERGRPGGRRWERKGVMRGSRGKGGGDAEAEEEAETEAAGSDETVSQGSSRRECRGEEGGMPALTSWKSDSKVR